MQITRIEELTDRSRCKIFIDGQFAFILYKGELRLYHIREGAELPDETYHAIMGEVLPKRARLRAMNLLKSREYTTAQLRGKLENGQYPEAVVEDALNYVASFHYTDDLRYATDYITCHEESRSRRRIEQDLKNKGVSEEIIRTAWAKWEEQGGSQDEEQMICKLLAKRGFNLENADHAERQKQAAFLLRKGFAGDIICRILLNNQMEA